MIYEYVSLIAYEGLGFKLREGEDVLYTLPTEQFGLPKSYGRKVKAKVLTVSTLRLTCGPHVIDNPDQSQIEICVEVMYKQLPL